MSSENYISKVGLTQQRNYKETIKFLWLDGKLPTKPPKNMENHVLGFFMKNIVFHIYFGITEYTYTV